MLHFSIVTTTTTSYSLITTKSQHFLKHVLYAHPAMYHYHALIFNYNEKWILLSCLVYRQLQRHRLPEVIQLNLIYENLRFFFFFFFFLGPQLRHVEVPSLGVKLQLQQSIYATATAAATADPSRICDLQCSSWQHRILNPLSGAGDRTASSWILDGFVSTKPQWELQNLRVFIYFAGM